MPRAAKDKIQQGERRVIPDIHRFVNSTPPANSFMHLFQYGTKPAAGVYPGAALARQQLTGGNTPSQSTGIITVRDATSPAKQYLTSATLKNLVSTGTGRLYLLDLLVTYNGIDANSALAQNMTGSAAGTEQRPRITNRNTVMFADVTTALGAGAANLTVTYTSTAGASGHSTGAQALTISSIVARIPQSTIFLPLQAGDEGVMSIQTAQLSAAMGAGSAFALCLADVLAVIDITTTLIPVIRNFGEENAALIEIPTGAALTMIWEPTASTASQRLQSTIEFSEADLDAA